MPDRVTQINALFKKEISTYLSQEVSHLFVTVTRVTVVPNLKEATVWVSFLNNHGSNLTKVSATARDLRQTLKQRLRLKNIPNITFKLDTGIEYANQISKIINQANTK